MRAKNSKLATRDGVAQVNVLLGTNGHALVIGAKGGR